MLETMLTSGETARLFVERGGVDLLLTLYRLPRLPPTFGSTNASHRWAGASAVACCLC